MKKLLSLFTVCSTAFAAGAEDGFLFVTFRGESEAMGEQVYFAVSEDGQSWDALNDGKPTLVSSVGEKGVRDPFIIRSHDGETFYLIATDLSINRNPDWPRAVKAGSKSIVVWESKDLVSWSQPRLVRVAPEGAGCTWAPEAVYDEASGDYLVFWASTSESDDYSKHVIWACRTKDFRSFGDPFVYIEKDVGVIDTTIVYWNGDYVRFSKDETFKAISMETSKELMGDWETVAGFSLANVRGYEGPLCFPLKQGNEGEEPGWCLLLDQYSKSAGYQSFLSSDLVSGQFEPAESIEFPFKFRHGTVIPISGAELKRLRMGYGVGS